MNYIFILLLLGCGGRGNGCCARARGGDCRRGSGRRERTGRQEACGCGAERSCREEASGESFGRARGEREDCDGAGLIPPPWQEYPKFSRRDGEEGCGPQS